MSPIHDFDPPVSHLYSLVIQQQVMPPARAMGPHNVSTPATLRANQLLDSLICSLALEDSIRTVFTWIFAKGGDFQYSMVQDLLFEDLENAEAIIIIVAQTFDRFCISAESKWALTYIHWT